MPPQYRLQLRSNEVNVIIAQSAIDQGQIESNRAAAALYNVNDNTLRNRRLRKPAQQDCVPNSKILTELEERVIIEYALNVDERGFQLNYNLLHGLADKLLTNQGTRHVGVNWPARFI
jgi:hypothetical protein